jgi:hypothetical protein
LRGWRRPLTEDRTPRRRRMSRRTKEEEEEEEGHEEGAGLEDEGVA